MYRMFLTDDEQDVTLQKDISFSHKVSHNDAG